MLAGSASHNQAAGSGLNYPEELSDYLAVWFDEAQSDQDIHHHSYTLALHFYSQTYSPVFHDCQYDIWIFEEPEEPDLVEG